MNKEINAETKKEGPSYYQRLMGTLRNMGEGSEKRIHMLCITATKEQIKGQLEKMNKQLDLTREALKEMRNIEEMRSELAREFGINVI